MKKIIYLFTAISISLTSCSKDENSSEKSSSVFVKRIVEIHDTNNPANNTETSNYKYNGNKIVSVTSDDGSSIESYTYTGDVITKIENSKNGNFRRSREYTYSDGKVATLVDRPSYGSTATYSFTYNSNGTVSYSRKWSSGENSTGLLTFVNGNIIKNEVFYGGQYPSTNTYTYEYDTKSNPFKNVLGFNLINLDDTTDMFSPNNMTKDGSGGNNSSENYIFKYDANGFPTERKNDVSGGQRGNLMQHFY